MCERTKDVAPLSVVVLACENDGKVTFAASCGKDAKALGVNAGKLVKAVAQAAGGNGGGKPDMAMAGAKILKRLMKHSLSLKKLYMV